MGDTDNSNDTQDPGDLRAKLEAANERARVAEEAAKSMQQDIKLRDEAGLGHLSDRQRRTILRDLSEEGTEFSPEAAKKIAEELGFPTAPPSAPTSNGQGVATNPAPVGNQQQDPPVPSPANQALDAFSNMQTAQQAAIRGNNDPGFQAKVKATKSPEELRDLIRREGAASGLVHSWDT